MISQAAIREFQINTSNYSAEYGRSAGGVTNAVTKSGTNDFHGEVFYYNRNNRNGARNPRQFQSVLVGGVSTPVPAKPIDLRQQWGGSIGGPIVQDKIHFFAAYDGKKIEDSRVIAQNTNLLPAGVGIVPTVRARGRRSRSSKATACASSLPTSSVSCTACTGMGSACPAAWTASPA